MDLNHLGRIVWCLVGLLQELNKPFNSLFKSGYVKKKDLDQVKKTTRGEI